MRRDMGKNTQHFPQSFAISRDRIIGPAEGFVWQRVGLRLELLLHGKKGPLGRQSLRSLSFGQSVF